MKKIYTSALFLAVSAGAALASDGDPCRDFGICTSVPEISAMDGAAALATLAAVLLFAWERRRRAV